MQYLKKLCFLLAKLFRKEHTTFIYNDFCPKCQLLQGGYLEIVVQAMTPGI